MKVHVIKLKTIYDFTNQNSGSKVGFNIWVKIIRGAEWKIPSNIIDTFGSADILGNGTDRVVFNIGVNKYRMICSYYFGKSNIHLYINWIGTHAEYDKICANNLQYNIQKY